MDVLTEMLIAVVVLGVAGTVLEVVAIARRMGRGPAVAAIVLRMGGIAASAGLVLAGRGRADFESLVYALWAAAAGGTFWLAATVIDVVLLVRRCGRSGV